jgi:hypothetical protein
MYFVENSGIFFGKQGFAGYEAMIPTRDYLFVLSIEERFAWGFGGLGKNGFGWLGLSNI